MPTRAGSTAAPWKTFEPIAELNLGILYAAKGIEFFQANDLGHTDDVAGWRYEIVR